VLRVISHGAKSTPSIPEPGEDGDAVPTRESRWGGVRVGPGRARRPWPDRPAHRRQLEIERMIQVLCRRRRTNPLSWVSGRRKTALAEVVALRIQQGDVPDALKGARISRSTSVRSSRHGATAVISRSA